MKMKQEKSWISIHSLCCSFSLINNRANIDSVYWRICLKVTSIFMRCFHQILMMMKKRICFFVSNFPTNSLVIILLFFGWNWTLNGCYNNVIWVLDEGDSCKKMVVGKSLLVTKNLIEIKLKKKYSWIPSTNPFDKS